jgi:hypothetical protein
VHYSKSTFSKGGAHPSLLSDVVEFLALSLLLVPFIDPSFGALLGTLSEILTTF